MFYWELIKPLVVSIRHFIRDPSGVFSVCHICECRIFLFSWQEQYLTRSLRSLVTYCSCHSNIKFISSLHCVISSIYYLNTAFLMIFRRFPTTFRRFSKTVPKARRMLPNIFSRISENFQRCLKIAEDFRGRPEDVSMIHQRI